MPIYEYKVVPAPVKGRKGKGTKGTQSRFALALESLMNELGAEGWEYLRADTLPCEERSGLTGSTTTYQNMLVFRRESAVARGIVTPAAEVAPETWQPAPRSPAAAPAPAPTPAPEPVAAQPAPPRQEATAAAAAAAAALSAYRGAAPQGNAPRIGPARGNDDDNVAAE